MWKKFFIVLSVLFMVLPVGLIRATQFEAVLVGINEYEEFYYDLNYCVADAERMRDYLYIHQGWSYSNMELVTNEFGKKNDIKTKIQAMHRTTVYTSLFFFSGHGDSYELWAVFGGDDWEDGLLPYDSRDPYGYPVRIKPSELQSWFGGSYDQYCCFLDACGSGLFATGGIDTPNPMSKGVVSTACMAAEFAAEPPPLEHGAFTYYLLKGLENNNADPDGVVSAEDLYAYAQWRTHDFVESYYGPYYPPNQPYRQYPQMRDNDIENNLNLESADDNELTWGGECIEVDENINIQSGHTLKIHPGTEITFKGNYNITVHGKIEADGATFQSSGSGRWYGIDVDGSSSSYIKNCQIKDCDYGIIVGGSCAMSIKKNDIQAHYTGIRITEDSNPWIEDCYIQAKTIAPLITTGNGDGVVMRCNLGNTTPYNGPYYGHENIGSGSTCFNYQMCGRNKFENNITYIGAYILGGYPTYAYGYNWIERPAYTTPYHIYNSSGHSIGAQNNYWGGLDPLVGGYTVYYQPVLGSAPDPVGPSWSLSKEFTDVLYQAWQAYRENDYAGAKELAKSAFQSHRSYNQPAEALFLAMKSAYREGMLADEEENLISIMKDKSSHYTANY